MYKVIETPCGKVRGIVENNIAKFKGIRYAIAERWKYPTLVTKWDGIIDAFNYGPSCYQKRAFEDESIANSFYYKEYREGLKYSYSEDCLFLNIFKKEEVKENDNLPVLVYIHGGGFKGGCGHEKHFDEPIWPLKGMIGVTINYRLGPLGFMALEGIDLNLGLYDQVEALRWIKNNISSFGGDPNNVTLMGQSAGAMSATHLILSPSTKGLFHKAVLSSGGGVSTFVAPKQQDATYGFWRKIVAQCKLDSIEELRKCEPKTIYESWVKVCSEIKNVGLLAGPVIDNILIQKTNCLMYSSQFLIIFHTHIFSSPLRHINHTLLSLAKHTNSLSSGKRSHFSGFQKGLNR